MIYWQISEFSEIKVNKMDENISDLESSVFLLLDHDKPANCDKTSKDKSAPTSGKINWKQMEEENAKRVSKSNKSSRFPDDSAEICRQVVRNNPHDL
jgi:hypothetical protein